MNKVIANLSVVLVVCLGTAQQQPNPVDGQTRIWSSQDQIEISKVFEGKPSKTFFITQTHALRVAQLRHKGYKLYLATDQFHGTISWTPFLCKEQLTKPTLWDVQRSDSMYIQCFWSQKVQKWAVWFGPSD